MRTIAYCCTFFLFLGVEANCAEIQLKIGPIQKFEGYILLSLFDQENGFPGDPDKAVELRRFKVGDTPFVNVELKNILRGRYAISVYHDDNANGVFDLGLMGIPVERYGFSNNAKGRFGPPPFKDAAFEINAGTTEQTIYLN